MEKMLSGGGHEFLQIKQDDKFFSRLLSRENSSSKSKSKLEGSFRFSYYREASSAVPFTWESEPGTPKHPRFSADAVSNLPPLTPPPSFGLNSSNSSVLRKHTNSASARFFTIIFPKLSSSSSTKLSRSPSFSSASISSSSSSYSFSHNRRLFGGKSRCNCSSSANSNPGFVNKAFDVEHYGEEEGEEEQRSHASPTSTLCFGGRRSGSSRSFHHVKTAMKKKFLSAVGHATV